MGGIPAVTGHGGGHGPATPIPKDEDASAASWYLAFAAHEAKEVSPRYEEFALGVAGDRDVLHFLTSLPEPKRQPNLLFAAVKYLTGVLPAYSAFRSFVLGHLEDLRELMLRSSTQTNEPGRCAVLLPLLSGLRQPLALLEAGAAAGLCLLPDRYGYDYGGRFVGPPGASVVFSCEVLGPAAVPGAVPHVAWRRGIDLHPLDVTDPDAARWLTALVWAGNTDREERLQAALRLAAADPPPVVPGDAIDLVESLAMTAPPEATLVVFHSAFLPYLDPEDRSRFVDLVSNMTGAWISFEGRDVLPEVEARVPEGIPHGTFLLAMNGEPIALGHPHGRWIRWLGRS